jgi:phosphatidylethanolamine/phosphatidyl-N-methylethanolamine N-methyltransferase
MMHRLKKIWSPTPINHKRRRGQFLVLWAKSPMRIGGILPSSRGLARAMAAQVDVNDDGVIIELGAGTGMVTHALVERGVPSKRLLVIEREESLLAILRTQFPKLTIIQVDALHLDVFLKEQGVTEINAIISSLPLLTMPRAIRHEIEAKMAEAIVNYGGHIVQFTYGSAAPLTRERWVQNRIYGLRKKSVMTNIPPAYVWLFKKDERKKQR